MTDAPNVTPPTPSPVDPQTAVKGPATFLMVVGAVGIIYQLLGIVLNILVALGLFSFGNGNGPLNIFSGGIGIVINIIGIIMGPIIILGALKMKKLQIHGFATAASVLAMVPCISPCCLLGLPAGIWAMMTLSKPEVKAAFSK